MFDMTNFPLYMKVAFPYTAVYNVSGTMHANVSKTIKPLSLYDIDASVGGE